MESVNKLLDKIEAFISPLPHLSEDLSSHCHCERSEYAKKSLAPFEGDQPSRRIDSRLKTIPTTTMQGVRVYSSSKGRRTLDHVSNMPVEISSWAVYGHGGPVNKSQGHVVAE